MELVSDSKTRSRTWRTSPRFVFGIPDPDSKNRSRRCLDFAASITPIIHIRKKVWIGVSIEQESRCDVQQVVAWLPSIHQIKLGNQVTPKPYPFDWHDGHFPPTAAKFTRNLLHACDTEISRAKRGKVFDICKFTLVY